jgi:hypothetical protein
MDRKERRAAAHKERKLARKAGFPSTLQNPAPKQGEDIATAPDPPQRPVAPPPPRTTPSTASLATTASSNFSPPKTPLASKRYKLGSLPNTNPPPKPNPSSSTQW